MLSVFQKERKWMWLVIIAILLTVGCGNSGEVSGGERTQLVIAESDEWWGLDTSQLDGSFATNGLVADPVVLMDEKGNLVPCIASEVKLSEDGKTIRLTIPEGMKFANGDPLNPEDVVASLTRAKTAGPFGTDLEPITSMDIEERDVILRLEEYTCNIANTLSGSFVTILSKKEIESKTNDELLWDCHPYGMYTMKEYVAGSHVILERNPNYITHNPYTENKGVAAYETIKVRFMKEEFSRVNAFNIDDIQAAFDLSIDGLNQLTTDKKKVEDAIAVPNVHYLEVNQNSEFLKDINIRQAIGYAINREDIVEANKGAVVLAQSVITSKVLNYSDEYAQKYAQHHMNNVEKARELLAASGWKDSDNDGFVDKNGQKLKLLLVGCSQATDERSSQALQIQLKEIGIDLELELLESNYRYEKIEKGDFDLGFEQFGTADPILLMNWIFTNTDNLIKKDQYYELISKAQHTPDSEKRTGLLVEAQQILTDEAVIIPLYTVKSPTVWASDLGVPKILNYGHYVWNDLK